MHFCLSCRTQFKDPIQITAVFEGHGEVDQFCCPDCGSDLIERIERI
jgi:predicted RNA-binding Zn-ribbon protein involved in translation (DUF1610 family)